MHIPAAPPWQRLLLFSLLTLVGAVASAAAPASESRHHDARIEHNARFRQAAAPVQREREASLRQRVRELRVEFDETFGTARSLTNMSGALSAPRSGDALTIGLEFVQAQRDLLGLTAEDLADYEVTDRVYSELSGTTHLYLRQRYGGLPVYNAQLQLNVDRQGRMLSVHNDFQPHLAAAASRLEPQLGAGQAVASAARHLGLSLRATPKVLEQQAGAQRHSRVDPTGISKEPIDARLMLLPVRRGEARLVWNFQLHTEDEQHVYDMTVDAASGKVWTRFDWVAADNYRVYPQPVESPNHTTPLPPSDGRSLVLNPANSTASPFGWHDTNGVAGAEFTTPRGNNVHAYEDSDFNNLPPASEPNCGASLSCDFPIGLSSAPSTYRAAAISNLFYWNNLLHDIQFQYGFTSAAGNFQVNTYGGGGLGSDDVRAEAQDGGGMNNANFFTPPDGQRPRMQMYLWNLSSPQRDGDLDSGIIVHEYGHGISNRLVGGPSNVSCLTNSQQPGEGLSDWWSLVYTARATDTGPLGRGVGTYALNQPTTGLGIRTQRYSTDPAVNTWTYASINGMAVPHGVGSVWAQAAWEAYWALVDKWGFSTNLHNATGGAGNQRMMLYVNEGLKFTPCNPTFTQVRDGIIQAATLHHSGEDVCRLWTAFASFGLGSNAISNGPNSTAPVNGFSVPTSCRTDAWGKDKPWDTGLEPDPATQYNNMWESEDIRVRNSPGPGPHQNPEYGQTNYVYVTVRNKSAVEASNVLVKVYGTAAATSTSWPSGWTFLGETTVVSLAPNAVTEVVIPWQPQQQGHYCLLSRLVTVQDPMTYTETGDPNYNTRNNNNIIWKNVNVVDLVAFQLVRVRFLLHNALEYGGLFRLRLREPEEQLERPFLRRGRVELDLGPELMMRWRESGGEMYGFEQTGETSFEARDPRGSFFGVKLEPGETFELNMLFEDTQPRGEPTKEFQPYTFQVVQEDAQSEKDPEVGGVTYELRAPLPQ